MADCDIAATTYRRKTDKEGAEDGEVWVSPIIDASRGHLRTGNGRMGKSAGDENEKYGEEPYVEV